MADRRDVLTVALIIGAVAVGLIALGGYAVRYDFRLTRRMRRVSGRVAETRTLEANRWCKRGWPSKGPGRSEATEHELSARPESRVRSGIADQIDRFQGSRPPIGAVPSATASVHVQLGEELCGVACRRGSGCLCWQANAFENKPHHRGFGDVAEHAEPATTLRTGENVDLKRTLEKGGPVDTGGGRKKSAAEQAVPVAHRQDIRRQ
jgi:hypothetical protein